MGSIVVTGAASGMGAATRARLERSGHSVIGVDRAGVEVNVDLSTASGRAQAIEDVQRLTSALQGVIACAGLGLPNPEPAQIVSVNFFGVVELLDGLLPLLVAGDGKAAIVASAVVAALPDIPEELIEAMLDNDEPLARNLADKHGDINAYGGSKFAVTRWMRRTSAKPEWAGRGVSLNGIAPGATRTPMLDAAESHSSMLQLNNLVPVPAGREATADEMAALLEVLISPVADLMIGQMIYLDGGTEALLRSEHWPATWSAG